MLLRLTITPYQRGNAHNAMALSQGFSLSSFFNPSPKTSPFPQTDHFDVPEIKIKCINESYFLFFDNKWVLIKSDDQVTCGQHMATFGIIPEYIPLPFEVDSSETQPNSFVSFGKSPLTSYQDPLFFLYNTPAQTRIDNPSTSQKPPEQGTTYLFPSFWDVSNKGPSPSSGNQILSYSPPEEKKKVTNLVPYVKQSKTGRIG